MFGRYSSSPGLDAFSVSISLGHCRQHDTPGFLDFYLPVALPGSKSQSYGKSSWWNHIPGCDKNGLSFTHGSATEDRSSYIVKTALSALASLEATKRVATPLKMVRSDGGI